MRDGRVALSAHLAAAVLLAACGTRQGQPCDCEPEDPTIQRATIDVATRHRGPRRPAGYRERQAAESEHPHPGEARLAWEERRAAGDRSRTRRTGEATIAARTTTLPVRFGLMHAHTLYSDGSGTPQDAFGRAKSLGLDFLAVTEHNHSRAEMGARLERRDGVLIANDPDLYGAEDPVTYAREWTDENGNSQSETATAASLIEAARSASDESFVALFGQEYSSISAGNHVNVIGVPSVITTANGDFRGLYEQLLADHQAPALPIVQLNHPNVHTDFFYRGNNADTLEQMFSDYGFDDYDHDFETLVQAADSLVVLIEVLTGPAMTRESHPRFHYRDHENDYYYYLIQGFHVSPSVGHDNHYPTWGDATPARMGVFAAELSEAAVTGAMRANRTYASEDADLRVEFFVNDASMGDVLDVAADTELSPTIRVEDQSDTDAEYLVELIYGDVVPQRLDTLEKWIPEDGLAEAWRFDGDGELDFDTFVASGRPEFFYVRVTQGDGDRAWTAPVWINHPRTYDVGN